jgi:hypothetical protein
MDCSFIYRFTARLRIFHLYGDVIVAGEGLQNFRLIFFPAKTHVPAFVFTAELHWKCMTRFELRC